MTALIAFIFFALVAIIALFIAYTAITNSIIKTQERQLARMIETNNRLRQANKRLKKALDETKAPEVVNIYTEGYQKSLKESCKGLKFGD